MRSAERERERERERRDNHRMFLYDSFEHYCLQPLFISSEQNNIYRLIRRIVAVCVWKGKPDGVSDEMPITS